MSVSVAESLDEVEDSHVLVVPVFTDDDFQDVGPLIRDSARIEAMRRFPVARRMYEITGLISNGDSVPMILIHVGSRANFEPIILQRAMATASRYLTARLMGDFAVLDREIFEPEQFGRAVVEGSYRGAYDAQLRKVLRPGDRRVPIGSIVLISSRSQAELEHGAHIGSVVGECSSVARDLVNLPPNELTPTGLAERAQSLAAENDLECSVLNEGDIRDLGMGALLAVASGSDEPPRVVVLRHGNPAAATKLALVGKGLTFDSGGLSLKTAEGMETMKGDMGGAAAVIAGILAVKRLGLDDVSVTAYVGSTENMPSGHAVRPGDVVTSMSGETIEVLNTDAEGRLVLADVLTYAEQQGATHIVDFATLTGGAITALGHDATLAVGRPQQWVNDVVQEANTSMERAWPMPMFPEYRALMETEMADIRNSAGRPASPMTAAAFLGDFVHSPSWAHMDIAGTAWAPERKPYLPPGGTGVGVGTIVGVVQRLIADQHGSED